MIIENSIQLRDLTGSFYANSDFDRIRGLVETSQWEVARIIGTKVMAWLETEGSGTDAWRACATAVGYLAVMRYYRLNDISHEDMGRKVKIDKENEARPFEWQLARDDRMHLEEYYRALDWLVDCLNDEKVFRQSELWQRMQRLIVSDAGLLASLTGVDASPFLFVRMVPFLAESQHYVEKAYGEPFATALQSDKVTDKLLHAARKAVALGGVAQMGRRTSFTMLPYGLMRVVESDGGGNSREQTPADQLNAYMRRLSADQHYWLEEMKTLRDAQTGVEPASHLQMPDNDKHNRYIRL